jgi:hypothetical protein
MRVRFSPVRLLACALLVLPCVAFGGTPLIASAAPETDVAIARVLELTNIERQKVGVPPLALSTELTSAAQSYSVVLATSGCFAHTCGPVPDMADRLDQAGYQGWTAIAENIAAGYPTPETVVAGWMSSPGHRENLLSPSYAEIGIGLATGGGRFGTFWAQDFGSRRVVPTAPAMETAPPAAEPANEPAPPAPEPVVEVVEPMPEPDIVEPMPESEAVVEEEAPPEE